jgi:protein-tyrosine phosphatase
MHPWEPSELYAGGVRVVVSLSPEEHVEGLEAYGFTHYRAEFPPVTLYSTGMQKAFIYQALPVWEFIHQKVSAGIPTLVHCFAGNDRTGAILAGYFITYHGMAPELALQTLRNAKPTAMSALGYAAVLGLLNPGELPDPRTLL